jgi:hypothetical protein
LILWKKPYKPGTPLNPPRIFGYPYRNMPRGRKPKPKDNPPVFFIEWGDFIISFI